MTQGRRPDMGHCDACGAGVQPVPRRLVVATRNAGKLREISALLQGIGVEVLSLEVFPHAPDVPEPHETFLENAADKAVFTARAVGEWVVADDSGLVVDALDGAPGVKSSRVAETDPERIAWVLGQMRDVPADRRSARFVCVIVLASPEGVAGHWEQTVEGVITHASRGEKGFGYDPVFLHPPSGKTLGEMTVEEKGAVSHRGKALREFRRAFEDMLRKMQEAAGSSG